MVDQGSAIRCTMHLTLPTDVTNEFPHGTLSLGHSIWPYENAAISTTVSMDYRTSALNWIVIFSNTLWGCSRPFSNSLYPGKVARAGDQMRWCMFQKKHKSTVDLNSTLHLSLLAKALKVCSYNKNWSRNYTLLHFTRKEQPGSRTAAASSQHTSGTCSENTENEDPLI